MGWPEAIFGAVAMLAVCGGIAWMVVTRVKEDARIERERAERESAAGRGVGKP